KPDAATSTQPVVMVPVTPQPETTAQALTIPSETVATTTTDNPTSTHAAQSTGSVPIPSLSPSSTSPKTPPKPTPKPEAPLSPSNSIITSTAILPPQLKPVQSSTPAATSKIPSNITAQWIFDHTTTTFKQVYGGSY